MDIWSAVKRISHETGLPMTSISKSLGHHDTYVSNALGRGKCPSFDNANTIVREFGYSVCLIKQGDEPDSSLVIDETMDDRRFTARAKESASRMERERRRKALQAELDRLNELD